MDRSQTLLMMAYRIPRLCIAAVALLLIGTGCIPELDYHSDRPLLETAPRGEWLATNRLEYTIEEEPWLRRLSIPVVVNNYSEYRRYVPRCNGEMPRFELERQTFRGKWETVYVPPCPDSAKRPISIEQRSRHATIALAIGMRDDGTPRFLRDPSPGIYRLIIPGVFDSISGALYTNKPYARYWRRSQVHSNQFEVHTSPLYRLLRWGRR